MDIWVIILIVLIFIIIYAMYMITKTASLIKAMSPLSSRIEIKDDGDAVRIPSPTSQRYYYEAWVYITDASMNNTIVDLSAVAIDFDNKYVIGRLNSSKGDYALAVFKDNNKTNLWLLAGNTGSKQATSYLVTADMPMNKWVYLVMNIDNKLAEVYVNGKLLKTVTTTVDGQRAAGTVPIKIGGDNLGGYITRAIRKPENIDPTKVWNNYLQGNGQYAGILFGLLDYINSYAFNMNITSNGKVQRQFTAQLGGTETN